MSSSHCENNIAKSVLYLILTSFAIAQDFTSSTSSSPHLSTTTTTCSANTDIVDGNNNINDNSCTKTPSMKRTMASAIAKVIPKDKLYMSEPNPSWFGNKANAPDDPSWTNGNWLKSRFHFSFAEYNNPKNSNFGVLRVMNDDLVQPKRGFGTHPHRDMEIITYIVHGQLTHKDSIGNGETLGRGSIQFMTAGSGIQHSETNDGDKPLRFIQTWIVPRSSRLKPNYGSYNASTKSCESQKNSLLHLASDTENKSIDSPVKVNQNVNCKAAEIELGNTIQVDIPKGRQAYLLCIEGELKVNGKTLTKYDGMEIHGTADDDSVDGLVLDVEASGVEDTENGKVAHFLMFDMPADPRSGRTDV
jgi:redox-sensitive bicupin YhaK (pirin superfamily)